MRRHGVFGRAARPVSPGSAPPISRLSALGPRPEPAPPLRARRHSRVPLLSFSSLWHWSPLPSLRVGASPLPFALFLPLSAPSSVWAAPMSPLRSSRHFATSLHPPTPHRCPSSPTRLPSCSHHFLLFTPLVETLTPSLRSARPPRVLRPAGRRPETLPPACPKHLTSQSPPTRHGAAPLVPPPASPPPAAAGRPAFVTRLRGSDWALGTVRGDSGEASRGAFRPRSALPRSRRRPAAFRDTDPESDCVQTRSASITTDRGQPSPRELRRGLRVACTGSRPPTPRPRGFRPPPNAPANPSNPPRSPPGRPPSSQHAPGHA